MSTATQVKRRRGTTAQHSTFTGALGEITVDTDIKTIRVHDGIQAGGYVLLRLNADGSIPLGQFTVSADGTTITSSSGQSNVRWKNGQFQIFDEGDATATPSTPWRILGSNNGSIVLAGPVAT
jgi:hypothetical protein